jgi:hypothetical protein
MLFNLIGYRIERENRTGVSNHGQKSDKERPGQLHQVDRIEILLQYIQTTVLRRHIILFEPEPQPLPFRRLQIKHWYHWHGLFLKMLQNKTFAVHFRAQKYVAIWTRINKNLFGVVVVALRCISKFIAAEKT